MLKPLEDKKSHPFGIAPVITDGDLVVAEPDAILEYLNSNFGDKDRVRYVAVGESDNFVLILQKPKG